MQECPYCGKEMEQGFIQSPHEIAWLKGGNRHLFSRSFLHDGSVVLSELSLMKGSAVLAWLCRDCRKVIIDYGDRASDFNNA